MKKKSKGPWYWCDCGEQILGKKNWMKHRADCEAAKRKEKRLNEVY